MNPYNHNVYHDNMHFCNFDQGPNPFVTNLKQSTINNENFRTALWTGCNLQLTLMCIPKNSDIGLEIHPDVDQFLYIECGQGIVMMGKHKDCLNYQCYASEGSAIFVPAGTWHNLINTGCCPIKLFTIYAPPEHPWGTIHKTKADAEASERDY